MGGQYILHRPVESAVEVPLWGFLKAQAQPVSITEMHIETGAHPTAIFTRLARWTKAGFITSVEGRPKRYAMTDSIPASTLPPHVDRTGVIRPRERTARERLWRAMRVLPTFDLPTVILSSAASRATAADLVNCLQRSGHLRQLTRGNPTTGSWSTFRLIHNTGPKPPKVCHHVALDGSRRREVVDGNTGERFDISPGRVSLRRKTAAARADGGEG